MVFSRICLLLLMAMLSGCQDKSEKLTYVYLMEHPQLLKDEMVRCQQEIGQQDNKLNSSCEIIVNAATNLMAMMEAQQEAPEKFGQRVLDSQMAYAKAREALDVARLKLQNAKAQQTSAKEIAKMRQQIDEAQKKLDEKTFEMHVLMRIVGANTPE